MMLKGRCQCGNTQVPIKARNWAFDNDAGGQWLASASCSRCGRSVKQGNSTFRDARKAAKDAMRRLLKAKPRRTV